MKTWKQFLESKETIPLGDCFRFATELAIDMYTEGIIKTPITVVHAMVHPKWHNRPYPHAWVESNNKCFDWQMRQTKVGNLPKKDFYREYNPTDVKTYTPTEAIRALVKNKHHGPWD